MELKNALMMHQLNPGLYFHSDKGSRYSSEAVKTPLAVIGANLSMSSRGNWAKDDREKTELIPGKETHSRSEKVSPISLRGY
jgi:transposase InsO family protein